MDKNFHSKSYSDNMRPIREKNGLCWQDYCD